MTARITHRETKIAPKGRAVEWLLTKVSYADDECLIWPFGRSQFGYGAVVHNGRQTSAHRVMCILTHGERGPDMHAAHSCGVAECCNPRHLRWATPKENQNDRFIHGTHSRGNRSGTRKLSEQDVLDIRDKLKTGIRKRHVAREYGVTETTIGDIAYGRTWGWLV